MMARRTSLSKFLTGGNSASPSTAAVERSSSAFADGSVASSDDPQKECAIKVVIRARPLSDRELLGKTPVIVNVTRTSVQVINPVVFLDPAYLEAISSPTKRVTQRDIPLALTAQGIAAATAAGECRTFHFDRCFGVDNAAANETEPFANSYDIDLTTQRPNQELIFDEIGRDMIESALQGFNCTVLAYGQTGSGKTHTMVGEKTTKGKGLIPRVCEALFTEIDARRAREDTEALGEDGKRGTMYSAHVSYCEIYKEKVNDLLESTSSSGAGDGAAGSSSSTSLGKSRSPPTSPSHGSGDFDVTSGSSTAGPSRRTLRVREHPATGPFVEGLSSRPVTCYADIAGEMLAGEKLRTVASTLMNPVSSRSHAVFTITFTQTSFDPATQTAHEKTSKISMIDLAGSERANASGTSGDRLKEGAMINKSLTTLGRVISALSKQGGERVPYRDSTLTWLLKESLGGNAKTTMIAMISPSSDNFDETMSTLRYAESAKRVINRAVVNEDKNARIIRQLRQEIQELRTELEKAKLSPRKRSLSSAATSAADAASGLTVSLAEREAFHAQLLQEVDELRAQQALNASVALAPELSANASEEPTPHDSVQGSVHAHKTLPSLLVIVSKHFHPDGALVYVLAEGVTVFGSDSVTIHESLESVACCDPPDKEEAIAEQAVGMDETNGAEQDAPSQSPSKRSWSPTFLRRRSSSSAGAAAAPVAASVGPRPSSGKRGKSASPRKSKSKSCKTATQDRADTQFYRLVSRHDGDIAAQHVRLRCTKLHAALIDTGDDAGASTVQYCVTAEPLDARARVLLNGRHVAQSERVEMHHGDELQLGDSHRFSLYAPLEAAALSTTIQDIESDAVEPSRESLADLVATANAICTKWGLHMEFALQHQRDDGSDASNSMDDGDDSCAAVVVKKLLDRQRYSLVTWRRPMLEAKVAFLRQFAESLEHSGTLVVAERESEVEYERSDIRDGDDDSDMQHVAEDDTAQPSTSLEKVSSHRDADATAADADDRDVEHWSVPPPPPSHISSSSLDPSLRSTRANSHHAHPGSATSRRLTCIRLIGQGRVFMPPLKSYSSGPMIAAVFDGAGHSIGKLFMHLQYTTSSEREERRPSLMALARRPSLLTMSQASKPKVVETTMRVHLDKVVFDEPQWMASDGVSLTLKRWSSTKLSVASSSSKISGDGDGDGAGAGAPTANFSTPKVPPVTSEQRSAAPMKAPLTIFQVGKVFETRLCFGDSTTATQRKSNSATSNASAGGVTTTQDDFVAFEVWGYGQALAMPQAHDATVLPGTTERESRKIEFYVSVDIDEREHDGIFRPVAVKADGTLRLHANQPRRMSVRITQADQQGFALASIACVMLARPFSASVDTASLSTTGGKSTQWLLSPSSIRTHSFEEADADIGATTNAAVGGDGSMTNTSASQDLSSWRVLEFRGDLEQDPVSRSLTASLKWDRDVRGVAEIPDAEGTRSVFRVVIALTTVWSRVPVVISKSVATKIAPAVVSTKLKIARELETSRMAWWARESFSRDYRLGTWYTADVTATPQPLTVGDGSALSGASEAAADTQAIVGAVVASHIKGLQRLERVLELEHLRQQILKMTPFSATETVDASSARTASSLDELSFDKVAASLSTLFENGDDEQQRFEIVQLQSTTQLFLRKKTHRDLLIGVKYGNVVDVSPIDGGLTDHSRSRDCSDDYRGAPGVSPAAWCNEVHAAHFVTEPSHLATSAVGEMAGFLMLSTAFDLDEAAAAGVGAAVVAPLPSSPVSGVGFKPDKAMKAVRANWERRWFVLKRPFLYAYKTFALKEEVGVLDISRCQLLTVSQASSSSSDARNGWSHSSSSSLSSSSSTTTPARSARDATSKVLAAIPFSFQLVCLVGAKCIVWTLQASTAPEMRAWLVAIDPLKIQAREAVVSNNQSNAEAPVITA